MPTDREKYQAFLAAKLPDVTYDRDAGGVWTYFQMFTFKDGQPRQTDEVQFIVGPNGAAEWRLWGPPLEPKIGYIGHFIRRPIPRPTERLLEAMWCEGENAQGDWWQDPQSEEWTSDRKTATWYLTACEHSCQAEPGDGKPVPQPHGWLKCPSCKSRISDVTDVSACDCGYPVDSMFPDVQPVPQEMGEEWDADLDEYRHGPSGSGPHADTWADKPHRLVYDLIHMVRAARQTIASLQQQVRSESAKGSKEAWDLIESSIRASAAHLGIEIGDSSCPIYQRVTQVFDRLQQKVAGLTEERDRLRKELDETAVALSSVRNAHGKLCRAVKKARGYEHWPDHEGIFVDYVISQIQEMAAAEAERDRLREAIDLHPGWVNEDEMPDPMLPGAYDILYPLSRVIGGVRMFPRINGVTINVATE